VGLAVQFMDMPFETMPMPTSAKARRRPAAARK
jgi:hypothetical protein